MTVPGLYMFSKTRKVQIFVKRNKSNCQYTNFYSTSEYVKISPYFRSLPIACMKCWKRERHDLKGYSSIFEVVIYEVPFYSNFAASCNFTNVRGEKDQNNEPI